MSPLRVDALTQLFARAVDGGPALLCALPDGLHLKVVVRGQRRLISAWHEHLQALDDQECEEIGEDAGFYDPRFKSWACAESAQAHLIVDGFQGQLCSHKWATNIHFDGRDEYGNILTCEACGVAISDRHSRRGSHHTYSYDRWSLRPHIYQRWAKRGPVPGSIQPQAHHEKQPKKTRARKAKENHELT